MKRTIIGLVLGLILGSTITVFASESVLNKVEATIMDIKLMLNGEMIELKNKPLVYNQTTHLPIRELAEILDLEVGWNQENQMVTLTNSEIVDKGDDKRNMQEQDNANLKIYYNFYEVNENLRKKYDDSNYYMWGSVKNGVYVNTFQGIEYPTNNTNSYYDHNTGAEYLSEDYLLQFLKPEDLEGVRKYYIDPNTNTIAPLQ